jgi:AcrR family transcriptional regulator
MAFAERGYHGVSVRDLADAVGIKGGSFYSHFQSKEQLLYELVLLGHQSHQQFVRDGILGAGPDPREQLRGAIHANVTFHGTYPLVTIVGNSELHALAPANLQNILTIRHMSGVLITAVIERGNDEGVFDCDEPWVALSAIGGMGVRVAWWLRPPAGDAASPLTSYPATASSWFPGGAETVEHVADAYAEFALRIVRAT